MRRSKSALTADATVWAQGEALGATVWAQALQGLGAPVSAQGEALSLLVTEHRTHYHEAHDVAAPRLAVGRRCPYDGGVSCPVSAACLVLRTAIASPVWRGGKALFFACDTVPQIRVMSGAQHLGKEQEGVHRVMS